jgi:hypothetical protein
MAFRIGQRPRFGGHGIHLGSGKPGFKAFSAGKTRREARLEHECRMNRGFGERSGKGC